MPIRKTEAFWACVFIDMRKKSSHASTRASLGIVLVLLLIAFLSRFGAAFFAILVFAGGAFLLFLLLRSRQESHARDHARLTASNIINGQLDHLTRKRLQLIRTDAYGKPLVDKWMKEVDYFIDNHILSNASPQEQRYLRADRNHLSNFIVQATYARLQQEPVSAAFSDNMKPFEFERFCAEQLRLGGWNAHVTTQNRDQGVDIVAEKGGKRLVLQCKLYSGPVGNGAVQQIAAGRVHEGADYAAVVTNSRYTSPAEELASTNGILLLHHWDLMKLDDLLLSARPKCL